MAGPTPPGFNANEIIAGLHTAMGFGEPNNTADKATFYNWDDRSVDTDTDSAGIPFDPSSRPTRTPVSTQVPCAIEYVDVNDVDINAGLMQASKIKVTLLDGDYQQIKGFEFVVVGGVKYLYRKTEPPVALGSIDVWTVHCQAEDVT